MKHTRLVYVPKTLAENVAGMGKLTYFILGYIEHNYKQYELGVYLDRGLGNTLMLLHPTTLPESVWKDIRGYAIGAKDALEL